MQFINSSLDKLVKNFWDEDFQYLVQEFSSENWEHLKFYEKKLPARKYFLSSTKKGKIGDDGKKSDRHISFKNYLTLEKIRDKFDIKDMGDYRDHCLKKDVLLLADFFEEIIDTCSKFYGLDPCHYFSSPGLSWDARLKITGVKIAKTSDIDKYLFIEKGLTGGIY